MSSYAHGQVRAIQEAYGAVLERALPYWWCIADLRGLYIHETRGLLCGHIDGVEAMWSHEDAIAATTSG